MDDKKPFYLVTGSSGFLGHALCHHFGSTGEPIVGLDKAGPPFPPPNTECVFADLTSDESMQKTFEMIRTKYGDKIKAVFHLAAYYSFSGEDSKLYKELTIDGTRRLLRELENFAVGQFIFSSSMLVYKPNKPGFKLTEQSIVEPTWAYPKSKVMTEDLIRDLHNEIPAVVMRIAGVYDDVCQSIPLAHQIQRIYEKKLEGHLYSGNIEVRQSFIHVADLVSAFEAAVNRADRLPEFSIFNIGEEDAMTYDEIQCEVAMQLYGEQWRTIEVPKPIAKAGSVVENALPTKEKPFIKPWMIDRAEDNYEISIDKARTLLHWQPAKSLRTTLPMMLEGLKVDPLRWYEVNKLTPPEWLKQLHPKHNKVA